MKIKRGICLILVSILVMGMLQGCSGGGNKTLIMYSSLPEGEIPSYVEAFKEDTGIQIEYVRQSAGEVLSRLQVEKSNPQASIWFGGPADTYIAAAKAGVLEPYKSEELKNIPENYIDKEGNWSPIYVGAMAFACDSEWFKKQGLEYPKSWEDLLKPEFEGQISMAHPGSSGTAYTILSTIVQMKGQEEAWAYFNKLNKNIRQYTKSGSAPPKNVALGEAAIGISFSHDCLKPTVEGYPIELSFPADGTGYEIGAVAIVKGAKEEENAKKFIDWILSEKGQKVYTTNNSFRLPINKNVEPPQGAVKISDLAVIDYDFEWAGDNRKELIKLFTEKVAKKENLK